MNVSKDFSKGLLLGLVACSAMGAVGTYVMEKQEKMIKRYKKGLETMEQIAEELEQHVEEDVVREIVMKYEFDSIVIRNFIK
jgi:hypothetical protein